MSATPRALAVALLLCLTGCPKGQPVPPAAPMGTARVETLSSEQGSKAAAAVQAAQAANESNPDGPPKRAVAGELSVAAANLPPPTQSDAAEALAGCSG